MNRETVRVILMKDLNMKKVSSKMVLKNINRTFGKQFLAMFLGMAGTLDACTLKMTTLKVLTIS
jgi:hypothetical protein